jgi:hypothetical protein
MDIYDILVKGEIIKRVTCLCPPFPDECLCGRRPAEQFVKENPGLLESVLQDIVESSSMAYTAVWNRKAHDVLGNIILPFGKYEGKILHDIPIKYLDMTVSAMPSTWVVRSVQLYVSQTMMLLSSFPNFNISSVGGMSWNELIHQK